MNDKLKILLADDHLVVRMGLKAIIDIEDDMAVVDEAGNGREAVEKTLALRPDVTVLDLMMPLVDGVQASEEILRADPSARVLILTSFASSADLRRALDAGALGAIVKDSTHDELIAAIRAVAKRNRVLSPAIEQLLHAATPTPKLTPRHREILQLVAKGFSNREIARKLDIGPDCVKAHLTTAFARLGVSSRSEAVAVALSEQLLR